MARASLLALLLLAAAACAHASRDLLQTGNVRCPDGCDTAGGGCVRDTTTGGYRCIKCRNNLVVQRDTGRCGCARGRFATRDGSNAGIDSCTDCTVGSFCAGGEYVQASPAAPASVACPTSMTTLGTRAISNQQCVNIAGYSYAWDAGTRTPSASICPIDTYSMGLRKQRTCTPCGPGLSTWTAEGQDNAADCKLKAGYYLRTPGVAAPCPRGEYNAGDNLASKCEKCTDGVTTEAEGSSAVTQCTVLLPGWFATANTGAEVTTAQKCRQDHFCPGGTLAAITAAHAGVLNGLVPCHDGTWTKAPGAVSRSECLVPPGYSKSSNAITECANGLYRENWVYVAPSGTLACTSCGDGFQSEATEQLERFTSTNAADDAAEVKGAKGSCFIRTGEGSYQTTSGAFYAVACATNNYGAAGKTYGLNTNPCRDCPSGMVTESGAAPSNTYLDGTTAGFYDPKACVTRPGFGYNGRVATRCQQGYWNAGSNYDACTKCQYGTTTAASPASDGTDQDAADDCTIAPGFGVDAGVIKVCPVGTFNDVIRADITSACNTCATGTTTTEEGASDPAATSCNVCAPGYGGADYAACAGGTTCGGSAGANYGPAGRNSATFACVACPAMSQGFTFDWNEDTNNFTPLPVSPTLADDVSDCLAQYTQVEDNLWSLGSADITPASSTVADLGACVTACNGDAECMWLTFNYANAACQRFQAPAGTDQYVGFKAAPAGDLISTSSVKPVALASGRYTWWATGTAAIGTELEDFGSATVDACQKQCNLRPTCAAVVMTFASAPADDTATGSCSLRQGDATVDTGLRSLQRTVTTQLEVADAA